MKKSPLKRTAFKRKPLKPKKKKRPSVSSLKRKVWAQFSIFIRTRNADPDGFARCITCGEKYFWKDLQAGHFIRGRLNANLFNERGCWQQCYGCNIHRQGHVVVYYKKMLEMFGQTVIDELLEQNSQTRKWYAGELEGLLGKYSALNAQNSLVEKTQKAA